MTEKFYRDIAALKQPGEVNETYEATGLQGWIINNLDTRAGDAILDVGSGGKLTLPLARIVGVTGHILAVERSFENLKILSQQSLTAELETRIRFLQINIDDFDGHVREETFDRALLTRALPHIRHPRTLFNAIRLALKPGGIFFFCGPSRKDQLELKRFHASLLGELSLVENRELTFVEKIGQQCAHDFFSHVEMMKFERQRRFASPDTLYTYWNASSLYEEALDRDFRLAAAHYFQSHATFEMANRIIGVKAIR